MMKNLRFNLNMLKTQNAVLTFDKVTFDYRNLSPKRLWAWMAAEVAYATKSPFVFAAPPLIQIEPANVCNLRCPLCHVVTDDKPGGFLSYENYKKIIDDVGDQVFILQLWGWGEPFLNRDIYPMIKYAKNRGIRIITSTNGHFFDDDANIDLLIDSGLDAIIFAVDGLDAETYEKYRHRGDFDRVMGNLRRLVRRKRERGVSHPRVNLRMLVTRENEFQVPDMIAFARNIGADIFSLKTLNFFDNYEDWKKILPRNTDYRRFSHDSDDNPIRIPNPCKKLWNHPVIYRDGAVVPCDYHTGKKGALCNIFEDSKRFKSVWSGGQFRELRRRFTKGNVINHRCNKCSLNYADNDRCVSHAFNTAPI